MTASHKDRLVAIWATNPRAARIADILGQSGASVRAVGGCVRDALAGVPASDIDLCTDATPQEMIEIGHTAGIRTIPTYEEARHPEQWQRGGLKHGTVPFLVDGEIIEITTLRSDIRTDGRHAEIALVRDFAEDASRRDFTFNAMSVDRDGELHDYFGGAADLAAGRVRFVGDPSLRISEDYLRILRFFRFRARYGRDAEDGAALQAIASGAHGLDDLSGERIWSELCRILCTPGGYRQSRAMRDTGVSSRIGLPIDPDDPCDSTRVCAAAAANGAMCAIVIGFALAGKPVTDFRYIQERWRLSRADRELMEMATTLAAWETRPLTDFMLLATRCERHVPPLASILRAFGRDSDADILRRGSPQFPVRGEDLVRLGFPPGKEVGRTLASLRKRWELSGFKDDREQLLEAVSMAPPAAPRI